jgi:signal transduction histidine kinase
VEARHYGLLGMRERVRLAGGGLEVRSEPGKGTCILIRFPLENVSHA